MYMYDHFCNLHTIIVVLSQYLVLEWDFSWHLKIICFTVSIIYIICYLYYFVIRMRTLVAGFAK